MQSGTDEIARKTQEDLARKKQTEDMLRLAAEHSWNNEKGNFRHRRQFQAIGIESAEQLRAALDKAVKEKDARSFDRPPDPQHDQTERSTIFEAKIRDQAGKDHKLSVVLNPNTDPVTGRPFGGTAFLEDPSRKSTLSRWLEQEIEKGNSPKVLIRGQDLERTEAQAVKSPVSRLQPVRNAVEQAAKEPAKRETLKQQLEREARERNAQQPPKPSPSPVRRRTNEYERE